MFEKETNIQKITAEYPKYKLYNLKALFLKYLEGEIHTTENLEIKFY